MPPPSAAARGFTIIEVALVLAIAGLIFLVVFLALPALQKSQRDTARRQDVGKAIVALQQYFADGGSTASLTSAGPGSSTINKNLADPDLNPLGTYLVNAGFAQVTQTSIYNMTANPYAYPYLGKLEYFVGEKCGAKNSAGYFTLNVTNDASDVAVAVRLESGNANSGAATGVNIYCVDVRR